jgi:four helix bundle protein
MSETEYIQEPKVTYGFQSYEDLLIWQKGMLLVNEIYTVCKSLPKSEDYILASQIKRAAISVPSNISEGWARKSDKAFANHLRIAFGSIHEVITQLQIINNLYHIDVENTKSQCQELSKMLNGFIKHLNTKQQSNS